MSDIPTHAVRYVQMPDADEQTWSGGSFFPEERKILRAVNQKIAAAENLEEIMNFLFDTTRSICPSDRLGLAFLEENNDGTLAVAHYARADYEPLMLSKGYAEYLHGSSLEAVLQNGRPRIINDLEQYLKQHPSSRSTRLIVREGLRSSLTCPLIVEGRYVGFLFRSSREPNVYSERHVLINRALAERLSQAVEKAYRIEKLAAANQAYMEVLGFVSHEMKSPLASMIMDGELLLGDYLGELNEGQRTKIKSMSDKANYLLSLIREYLTLARIESGKLEASLQDDVDIVSEVIEPAFRILEAQIEEKKIKIEKEYPDEPATVTCDPHLLQIALVNLLGNAVKYGNDNGVVRISATPRGGNLRISVWNEGPGFPRSAHSRLFQRFSRVQSEALRKKRGTGVGLFTTWRIIQVHGGRIWAESEEGKWAEFLFEIPLAVDRSSSQDSDGK